MNWYSAGFKIILEFFPSHKQAINRDNIYVKILLIQQNSIQETQLYTDGNYHHRSFCIQYILGIWTWVHYWKYICNKTNLLAYKTNHCFTPWALNHWCYDFLHHQLLHYWLSFLITNTSNLIFKIVSNGYVIFKKYHMIGQYYNTKAPWLSEVSLVLTSFIINNTTVHSNKWKR